MSKLADIAVEASTCTKCDLASTRTQVVFGHINETSPLMFVGEAPGKDEDEQGFPFVGRSGKLLDQVMLEEFGVTRERVSIVNTVMCRPPGNRDPQASEIAACNEWLEAKLELIAPKVVITLGNFATKLLLFGDPAAVLRSGGGQPLAQMRADFVRAKQALASAGASL
jgi:DNA polymerase